MTFTSIPWTLDSGSIPTTCTVDLQAAICLTLNLQVGDNTALWVAWKSQALQSYKHSTSLRVKATKLMLRGAILGLEM